MKAWSIGRCRTARSDCRAASSTTLFFAKPEELVALASVVAKYGGFYASHVRNETDTVFDAWREAIDVGRKAHVPVEISHFKLASKPSGKAAEAVKLLETRSAKASSDGRLVPYQYWLRPSTCC